MSCKICNSGACASWMHSLEEQKKYDERQLMTNNVEDLQREIQSLKEEISELKSTIEILKPSSEHVCMCSFLPVLHGPCKCKKH